MVWGPPKRIQEILEEWGPSCMKYLSVQEWIFFSFFSPLLLRAAPLAHGSSQARGWIRGAAAGLHHSHTRSKPHLRTTLQSTATPDPYPTWGRPEIEPLLSRTQCQLLNSVGHNRNSWIFLILQPKQRSKGDWREKQIWESVSYKARH